MQTEIVTIPSRDWPWFAKSLVLGSLFSFILVLEIAALLSFGWYDPYRDAEQRSTFLWFDPSS